MRWSTSLAVVLVAAACGQTPDVDVEPDVPKGPEPELTEPVQGGAPTLRRLTRSQYKHALRDLFGDIVLPSQIEIDVDVDGLVAVGSAITSVSTRGVEQYERAAFDVANQVTASPDLMDAYVPCEPQGVFDAACMADVIDGLGLRAWRRPVTADERDRYLDVAEDVATTLGSFDEAVGFVVAGLLQSPHFLFREEVGALGDDGVRRYTDYELASRLSFALWNSIPDDALLAAAAQGELSTEEGLRAQAERMLADKRADDGVRAMFEDLYRLDRVQAVSKDPFVFEHMSATLGAAAQEQTLKDITWWVLEQDGDFRDLFTTRTTHLNRELASVYGVRAPTRNGFERMELPADLGRVGLFGQLSFLALQAHPVSTSPTLRGKFLRERVLCHEILPPPAGVDTSIPEPNPDAATMRERLAIHLENPSCAACHKITDPVGLAFEQFDGLGRQRAEENGATIDPSGDLDGEAFADAADLAALLHDHPDVSPCLVDNTFRYAAGRAPTAGEEAWLAWLTESFAWSGHSVKHLLLRMVTSDGFRTVSDVEVTP